MYVLWSTLKRLQPIIRNLSKSLLHSKQHLVIARDALEKAQTKLAMDRMNKELITEIHRYTAEVIKWNEIDEDILGQRAKIE